MVGTDQACLHEIHRLGARKAWRETNRYKIIKHKGDSPYDQLSDWIEVDEKFFALHENNLGMTILEKKGEGNISKAVEISISASERTINTSKPLSKSFIQP